MAAKVPLLKFVDLEDVEVIKFHPTAEAVAVDEEQELHQRRSLKVSLAMIAAYCAIGIIWGRFAFDWSIIDSIYFVVVTMTTVGYGDKTFGTGGAMDQIVGGIYVFIGVAFIGVAAGIILDHVSVRAEKQFRKLTAEATRVMAEGGDHHTTQFDLDKELKILYQNLYKDAGLIALVVLVGSVCMMALEGWEFAPSFYFACVTMTTVGYGDRIPTNDASKLFVCCFILVSFGVISVSISNLAAVPFEVRKLTNISKVLSQFGETLDAQELTALCESDEVRKLRNRSQIERFKYNPHVSRAEFILWQLQKQGKISDDDLIPCTHSFDALDADCSGVLNQRDIADYLHSSLYTPRGTLEKAECSCTVT